MMAAGSLPLLNSYNKDYLDAFQCIRLPGCGRQGLRASAIVPAHTWVAWPNAQSASRPVAIQLTPYLWAARMNGVSRMTPAETTLDMKFSDILSTLDFGFAGNTFEAHQGAMGHAVRRNVHKELPIQPRPAVRTYASMPNMESCNGRCFRLRCSYRIAVRHNPGRREINAAVVV